MKKRPPQAEACATIDKMPLYPAIVRKDGDTFVVLFPDIPHAHTNGGSREDAIHHAPDALLAGISMLMEKGRDIPAPRKPRRGWILVRLPSGEEDVGEPES